MSLPTTTEVYEAIAKVLECRSHRRGRKAGMAITIVTGSDGKTVVTDHSTGCEATIGKRSYKKCSPARLVQA